MLHTLTVRNLALIEQAELQLAEGLNVFSGATGGGKSLLVTALKLLRGEKAGAGLVRHGADELQVDGEFRLGGGTRSRTVAALVETLCGGAVEDDLLLVTRVVDRQGRSRVRIGGRPATLQALRSLGEHLLEIHGQGDARALMRPGIQCETLDGFAGTADLRAAFASALAAARAAAARLEELSGNARDRRQRLEFLRFQHRELQELRLCDGEFAALAAEHRLLANLDAMRQRLQAALLALQDGEANAADLLGQGARALRDAAAIDARLEPAAAGLDEAGERLADVCRQVQSGLARLELDPGRLAEVEARLDAVQAALRRFGPTEQDLRRQAAAIAAELAQLEDGAADPAELMQELEQRTAAAAAAGRRLLRARRKAAAPFSRRVGEELADLGMPHTEVAVAMADEFAAGELLATATEHGPVPVDFAVRINKGEPWQSMRETASGGELARIVLAIKKTLADQDRVPLLVLDEIDAEIGGRLGLQVGRKLAEVAQHHQVVIVTHLPQVAAFAQRHFLVDKSVRGHGGGERTASTVRALRGAEIERELAAMGSGDDADAAALQQARALVRRARGAGAAGAADAAP